MSQPGPKNLITDIAGLQVGNSEDFDVLTGTTVLLPEKPVTAVADIRGGGPGTREIDVMNPENLVEQVDAIALSGGSAFGLEAASGVMNALSVAGRGFRMGPKNIPIVPGAILFDLMNGGNKDWGAHTPYDRLGREAVANAGTDFLLGNVGAGLGATAGPLKGGLGSASWVTEDGYTVGALVAVNPTGHVVMPDGRTFWAWYLEHGDEFGGNPPPTERSVVDPDVAFAEPGNTTIAIVATDATMHKGLLKRVAIMAHDGFARAIRPVHTPFDGDTIFALSTDDRPMPNPQQLSRLGAATADCLARAIARAVYAADDIGGLTSYRSQKP